MLFFAARSEHTLERDQQRACLAVQVGSSALSLLSSSSLPSRSCARSLPTPFKCSESNGVLRITLRW